MFTLFWGIILSVTSPEIKPITGVTLIMSPRPTGTTSLNYSRLRSGDALSPYLWPPCVDEELSSDPPLNDFSLQLMSLDRLYIRPNSPFVISMLVDLAVKLIIKLNPKSFSSMCTKSPVLRLTISKSSTGHEVYALKELLICDV